jgi:glycosyltransferase involved in cell wall biosynthesis
MDYFDITIITPTIHERSNLLTEAVKSVENQKVKAVGHFVQVDESKAGPAYVRNRLVEKVQSEWIGFLDDDDILYPNHIEEYRKAHENSDVIYTWCDSTGREKFDPNSHFDPERLMYGNYIPITAAVRTNFFRQVGGFSEDTRYEDWDLWVKLLKAGARFTCVPVKTWCYRFLGSNRTFGG